VSNPAIAPAQRAGARLATLLPFGLPGLPIAAIQLVYAVYLPRFYAGLGMGLAAVGLAIAVVRIIDIGVDPILGMAIDRTSTPIGRYRPWLLAGAPVAMLGTFMLIVSGGRADAGYLILWLLVGYAGWSILNLAMTAWASILATGYNDRSRVYGVTQGMAVIGSTGLLLLPVLTHGAVVLGRAASMPTVGWIILIALPLCAIGCAALSPEPAAETGPSAGFRFADLWFGLTKTAMWRIVAADLLLTLGPGTTGPLYVYFFHDAKGFGIAEVSLLLIFYIGAGIVGAPTWARIAKRIGKHRTIQIACVAYAVTQTILMALPRVWPGHTAIDAIPTILGMIGVGFCASAFVAMIRALMADVIDEVRLETGRDLTSLLFSMVTTTTKIGVAITVAVVFPILALVGYNGKEGAVNTPHAIFGLEMCYLFAPIVLVFGGGAMFLGYRLDADRHADIRAKLDAAR